MRSTHTVAILEVPVVVYRAIKVLLERAGHDQATLDDGVIDMHGIGIKPNKPSKKTDGVIEMGTIISSETGRARVEFQVGGEVVQLDVDQARAVGAGFTETIEAAISDELIFKFLVEKVNLSPQKAATLLIDFRELRQGSKEAVNPS